MSSNNDIESILEREGFYLFTGNGDSMWPLLRAGKDIVDIRPCEASGLKRGDVALYRSHGKYVLHRVLEAHEEYYVTRGDNCVMTENIPFSDIVGKMEGFWKGKTKVCTDALWYRLYSHIVLDRPRELKYLKSLLRRI